MRLNTATRFMIWVAGADQEILARAPGDVPKQVSLAGVILTTSGLAMLSSAFAIRMALHAPAVVALAIGIAWGVAIANLDRWLITATLRQPTIWGNLRLALPRLGLAVIIGAVVSTPLTLQIFSSEIENELTVMQAEEKASFAGALAHDERYRRLPADRAKIVRLEAASTKGYDESAVFGSPQVADLRQQLDGVDKRLNAAEQAVVCEKEGTCGSGKAGAGPAFEEKVALRNRLRAEDAAVAASLAKATAAATSQEKKTASEHRANAKTQLAELRTDVGRTQAALDDELAKHEAAVDNGDGLLARLTALGRVSGRDTTLMTAHLALFGFFTAIECLPVLVKLLLMLGKPSLYEQLCTIRDEATYADAVRGFRAEHEQQEIEVRTALDAHEAQRRNHFQTEVDAAQLVLDAQKELAAKAVAAWKARHETLLEDDLDRYIGEPGAV